MTLVNGCCNCLYPGYFSGKSYQHTRNQEQNTNLFNLIRELIQKDLQSILRLVSVLRLRFLNVS